MLTKKNDRIMLSDTTYSVGKRLVQLWLPALSALYFGLASIWNLPAAEQVVGTMACFTTFFGVMLNVSSARYDASGAGIDGTMVTSETGDGRTVFSLEVDGDPVELAEKDQITFKVKPGPPVEGVLPQEDAEY